MFLREFDLDLPYFPDDSQVRSIVEEKNCDYRSATRLDYDLNWKEKRNSFRLQTRCVTAMFERLFGKMKTGDCWKILVECVDEKREERVLNLSGVLSVQVEFNHDMFFKGSDLEKKKMTLELLMKGLRKVSDQSNWSYEPFQQVESLIQQLDFSNDWVWKKPLKSPDNNYFAEVLCQHSVDRMDIFIIVKDKNGEEITRRKVITELPDEFAYAGHLGHLQWNSLDKVSLSNKKGNKVWTVQF